MSDSAQNFQRHTGKIIIMKNIYGAPSTGVPISAYEAGRIGAEDYTKELMLDVLSRLTEDEQRLKSGGEPMPASDYDYGALGLEDNVFAEGNIVHVLRHLRYDRHEKHTHRFFEIVCQVRGKGIAEAAGERLCLDEGSICLLSPGTSHRIEASDDASIILKIMIRRSDFDEIYTHLLRSDTLLTGFFRCSLSGGEDSQGWLLFGTGGDPEILDTLLRMRYYEVRGALTDNVMKEALIMQLFCRLVSKHMSGVRASYGGGTAGRLICEIKENFRTVTLEELSEKYHFTKDYISRLLRRASGKSFTGLVLDMRLDHACRLLRTTVLPISDIAADSGFGCREFFCKKFRERTGMTPTEWREGRGGDSDE